MLGTLRGHAFRLYGRVVSSGRLSFIKPMPGLPKHGARAKKWQKELFPWQAAFTAVPIFVIPCPTSVTLL